MNLRGRMRHVERRAGIGVNVTIPIIWDGRNEDRWRARLEEAHENGWSIRLFSIGIQDQAESVEEAEGTLLLPGQLALVPLRVEDDDLPAALHGIQHHRRRTGTTPE